jgi:hypothetical protein
VKKPRGHHSIIPNFSPIHLKFHQGLGKPALAKCGAIIETFGQDENRKTAVFIKIDATFEIG